MFFLTEMINEISLLCFIDKYILMLGFDSNVNFEHDSAASLFFVYIETSIFFWERKENLSNLITCHLTINLFIYTKNTNQQEHHIKKISIFSALL